MTGFGPDRLRQALAALGIAPEAKARIAVAVSGGADSMALVLAAAAALCPKRLMALTVDHGLRPEAAAEAAWVGKQLAPRGIAHKILHWRGDKPASNIQAEARRARYGLMEDYCAAHRIGCLLLAHHRRDQAETVLLRLARGSGVDGLAAMDASQAPLTRRDGPLLLRPLLDTDPEELRAYLRESGAEWVEDPSNQNLDYDRIKARALLDDPPLAGWTVQRLANVARNMRRARQALEDMAGQAMAKAVTWRPSGHAELDVSALLAYPEEIILRALAHVSARAAGADHAPRLAHLENLLMALRSGQGISRTLGGVEVIAVPEAVLISREPAAVSAQARLCAGEAVLWDGRFEIALGETPHILAIRALSADDWLAVKSAAGGDRMPIMRYGARAAAKIALSQPGIWLDRTLIAAPTLGFYAAGYDFAPLSCAFVSAQAGNNSA